MNTFFKKLSEAMDGTMAITVMKKDDTLTVSVLPKVGEDTTIIPITFSGTPEEIDEAFFEQINPILEKVKGLQTNTEDVAQSVEDAFNETKPKKKADAKKPSKGATKKVAEKDIDDDGDGEEKLEESKSKEQTLF